MERRPSGLGRLSFITRPESIFGHRGWLLDQHRRHQPNVLRICHGRAGQAIGQQWPGVSSQLGQHVGPLLTDYMGKAAAVWLAWLGRTASRRGGIEIRYRRWLFQVFPTFWWGAGAQSDIGIQVRSFKDDGQQDYPRRSGGVHCGVNRVADVPLSNSPSSLLFRNQFNADTEQCRDSKQFCDFSAVLPCRRSDAARGSIQLRRSLPGDHRPLGKDIGARKRDGVLQIHSER